MLKSKWKLFLGLSLLITGIILKLTSDFVELAFALIIVGGLLKLAHIVGIIKNKSYKPGWEILILILGLSLFFFGLYVCKNPGLAKLFIIVGLIFKTTFVVWFIKKIK